jgi:hypothetical protein
VSRKNALVRGRGFLVDRSGTSRPHLLQRYKLVST